MEVNVNYRGKEIKLNINKDKVRAIDILKELNLSPEYAFVAKNGEIVSEDEYITPQDKIKVVNAISGG
jgi:sulfur carrier protein